MGYFSHDRGGIALGLVAPSGAKAGVNQVTVPGQTRAAIYEFYPAVHDDLLLFQTHRNVASISAVFVAGVVYDPDHDPSGFSAYELPSLSMAFDGTSMAISASDTVLAF